MKFNDQFRFVRQNMKKNKTRVFMTILATAIGCAFLIVLASVGFGLHKSLVKDITERRVVTEIEVHGKEEGKGEFHPLTNKDIEYLEGVENVKAVTRRKILQQQALYSIGDYQVNSDTVVAHMPSELKSGFELSEGTLPKSENEVVLGYHFIKQLAPTNVKSEELYGENGIKEKYRFKENLIGKEIDLTVAKMVHGKEEKKSMKVKVTGISKKPSKDWLYDTTVYISDGMLTQIETYTGTPKGLLVEAEGEKAAVQADGTENQYDQVKVYAKDMEAVKSITDKLSADDYATFSVLNELKDVNMIFNILKAGLIFIGTIAILIASIGIYNTMTMAVTERAPDIGIMKAIGANPVTIRRIFLLESSYIGLIGALIGTVVSYLISYGVNFAFPLIIEQAFNERAPEGLLLSHIPFSLPVICFVICYLVTILSGLRPAKRATQVDVLRAMRREV